MRRSGALLTRGAVLLLMGLGLLLVRHAARAQAPHPASRWEFALESGYLWKVRENSPLDYRIVPTQAVWRSPAFTDLWRGADGSRVLVRHRLALLAETFARGPEHYYLGASGAPSVEWWSADRRQAGWFALGGGFGWLDSQGVPGGQGQDLSFNWFSQLGYRRQLDERMAITAGLYFTHHSNLGMTDPNPGIDVLGVSLGVVWRLD